MPESEEANTSSDTTAFILTGGHSSRMGADKALLSFGDQSLLARALQTASAVAERSCLVGPKERYAEFGEVIEDLYRECGPLGGIHAALSFTSTDLNLILSVDMPLMTSEFLSWLVTQAQGAPELIVVPAAAGGLQPLCATYRKAVCEIAGQALQKGDYKVDHLFSQAPTRILTEEEIVANGFSPEIFRNVNTPEEYAKCRP